ncbi:ninjurin-B [Stomoxys calcitrans]|uniref:Ninjurin-1 n=1 Tax=Stomoxys calcitrans TaxID=35570 RepID=A0A1I8Q1H7_STOCA|nr:ninjurin-B [Stomoxys calcitrans]
MTSIVNKNENASTASSTSEQSNNDSESSEENGKCCKSNDTGPADTTENPKTTGKSCKISIEDPNRGSYAGNKNVAEGLMDIALLSANANQLRFLITYNHDSSTYFISMGLVSLSLIMQITVGIALIFKRRFRRCRSKRYNEFILGGVFIITVINILLAAFTTTNENK